jgi:Xaa-Pro aminopeptidase
MYEFETLTFAPIDRHCIDAGMLDERERAWIDGYHADVFRTLSPLLDDPTREWLDEATAPL